jgi:GT2 family glycosyltransferase
VSTECPETTERQDRAAVGAVVVSFDSADELPACLEALLVAESVAALVVVDNASGDGSAEVVRSYRDSRLTLVEPGLNSGFAGGCNRGLAALPAEIGWVAFINPDVVVAPKSLATAVAAVAGQPDVAGAAPRLMRPDGVTVDSVGQVLTGRTLEVSDRGYGSPVTDDLMERREVLAACGALAVYRRTALERVWEGDGPWAEHFFCFWEDLELGWRLVNRGWRVLAIPEAVATHGRGAGAASGRGPLRWRRPPELEACVLSNRWMTLARHLHTADLIRRLPILLAWDVAMTTAGVLRRPRLAGHLRRRLGLVYRELGRREHFPRKRLSELPW